LALKNITHNFSRRMSALYVAIFFVIIISVVSLNYMGISNDMSEEIAQTNAVFLKQLNQNIEMRLKLIDAEVLGLMQEEDVSQFMLGETENIIDRSILCDRLQNRLKSLMYTNDNIHSIYMYSDKSKAVLTHDALYSMSGFYDKEWKNGFEEIDGSYAWMRTRSVKSLLSDIGERNVITLIRKYTPIGRPAQGESTIVINIDEGLLYQTLVNAIPTSLKQIFIVDLSGTVISHNDKTQLYSNYGEINYIQQILKAENTVGHLIENVGSIDSSIYYIKSKYTGWSFISCVPNVEKNRTILERYLGLFLVTVFMLILGAGLVIWVSKRSFKPVDRFLNSIVLKVKNDDVSKAVKNDYQNFDDLEELFVDVLKEHKKMKHQVEESVTAVKWRFVMDILMGIRTNYTELKMYFEMLSINLCPNNFLTMVIEIDDNQGGVSSQFVSVICDGIESSMNQHCKGVAIPLNEMKIAMITSYEQDDYDSNVMAAFSIADIIKNYINKEHNISVTIGIGNLYKELREVSLSYKEALEALTYKLVMGRNTINFIEDFKLYDDSSSYKIISVINDTVAEILNGDSVRVEAGLEKIFNKMIDKKLSPYMIKQLVMQLLIGGIKVLVDAGVDIKLILEDEDYNVYEELNKIETIEHMKSFVKTILVFLVDSMAKKKNEPRNIQLMDEIRQYIDENYIDVDLSLNKIADKFHLSVPYLSKIFKESMGENFIKYLICFRMEKAKELLTSTNIKINDIAVRVGYVNHPSFIRTFKKYTGKTPGDFREQLIIDNIKVT